MRSEVRRYDTAGWLAPGRVHPECTQKGSTQVCLPLAWRREVTLQCRLYPAFQGRFWSLQLTCLSSRSPSSSYKRGQHLLYKQSWLVVVVLDCVDREGGLIHVRLPCKHWCPQDEFEDTEEKEGNGMCLFNDHWTSLVSSPRNTLIE